MGLFGFGKKGKSEKGSVNTQPVFRGDLAMLSRSQQQYGTSERNVVQQHNEVHVSDSTESVIYLSFDDSQKSGWYCRECGTKNSNRYNGCVVCGLTK